MTQAGSDYLNIQPRSLVSALIAVARYRQLSFLEAHRLVTPPCEVVHLAFYRAVRKFGAAS